MGYVPKDAKWFLADIVIECRVEGDSRNVVHKNLTLVRADSAEEAYEKATQLGKQQEQSYKNRAGKKVRFVYRGLAQLLVVHDPLEHGGELLFDELIGVPEEKIKSWLLPKEQLEVFIPWQMPADDRPEYADGRIWKQVMKMTKEPTPPKRRSKLVQ